MLILEMTLYQLDRSTVTAFGTERELRANRVQVESIEFTPSHGKLGTQLTVAAKVRGTTGNQYVSTIVYKKVVQEGEDSPNNITVKGTNGEDLHFQSVSLNNSDVEVRCTCLDFYWRFAMWNLKHRSLYGNPPDPYVKTTNRPPVNPGQKAGVCKHLYKLVQKLKVQGIMKNVDHSTPNDPEPMSSQQQQMQQKPRDANEPKYRRVPGKQSPPTVPPDTPVEDK